MEAGTGKSFIFNNRVALMYEEGKIDTHVVFAPNLVHRQWVEKAIPLDVASLHEAYALTHSEARNRPLWERLERHAGPGDPLLIVAFNIELLQSKKFLKRLRKALSKRQYAVTFDESHNFCTPSAKRTRAAWSLAQQAVARQIGTGTELRKGYENLYAQFRCLDWRIIGCRTYMDFKLKYCVLRRVITSAEDAAEVAENPDRPVDTSKPHIIVGYQNEDELMRRIEPYVFVCDLKDCENMPGQTWLELPVELTPEQRALMKSLRDNYVAELPTGEFIEADLAIQRLQKLQQITGGHIAVGNKEWRAVPTDAIALTVDLIRSLRGKVLLWCSWQPDIVQLAAALSQAKISYVTYYGGNTSERNMAARDHFENGPARVFLGTYAKGGTGIDFRQIEATVIHYTLTFNAVDYWQSLGRNYGIGTTKPVTYWTVVRPGSTDRKLLASLKKKEDLRKSLRDPRVFKQWLLDLLTEEDV
jgi:hypothetical protein